MNLKLLPNHKWGKKREFLRKRKTEENSGSRTFWMVDGGKRVFIEEDLVKSDCLEQGDKS